MYYLMLHFNSIVCVNVLVGFATYLQVKVNIFNDIKETYRLYKMGGTISFCVLDSIIFVGQDHLKR